MLNGRVVTSKTSDMAHLELAERGRTTRVSGYTRGKHHTRSHIRHLSAADEMFYIQVPDPNNKVQPKFVREDFFDIYSDDDFAKLLRFVTPFNDAKYLSMIAARRATRFPEGHLNDAGLLSDVFGDIVDIVAPLIPGGSLVDAGVKLLTGQTSQGKPTTQPVVTPFVQPAGEVIGWPIPAAPPGYHVEHTPDYTSAATEWKIVPDTVIKNYGVLDPQAATSGRGTSTVRVPVTSTVPFVPPAVHESFSNLFSGNFFGIPKPIVYAGAAFGIYKLVTHKK